MNIISKRENQMEFPQGVGETTQNTREEIDYQSDPKVEDIDEAEDPNLCIACHGREKDLSDNPDSQLCTDCRQRFIRYPIAKWVRLTFIFIAVLLVISINNIPRSILDLKAYQEAEAKYDDRYYNDSLVLYHELYHKYPQSVPLSIKLLQACMKQQNFGYAAYIIDNSLAGKEVNDSEYNLIAENVELLDRYFIVSSKVDEIIAEGLETYPDDLESSRFAYEQIKALDEKEFDKAIKLFYLSMLEEDPEVAVSQMQQAYVSEPEFTFIIGYIGNMQRALGMKKEALTTYEKALEHNRTDSMAIRGIGILELLYGNKEKGLEFAQKAFEIAPFDIFVPETLVIALYENGKQEEAAQLMAEHQQNEYIFDEKLDSYLNGSLTLEGYFTLQGGE